MKRTVIILQSMATLVVAMLLSCITASAQMTVFLDHYAGDRPLVLDTVTYKNALGQPFTVTKFKYYIGNIQMKKADGSEVSFADYYLVDEDEEKTKQIKLMVPDGEYTGISFIIGVDSLHNCSGAQAGALDPVNAMFWTWNTGYIFLKLEGKSPASKSPGNIFEYHIGGYKGPTNCIRQVSLPFTNPLVLNNTHHNGVLHIKADAAEVLKTPTTIDISQLSSVTDFHNATTIADNYKDMFSIISVRSDKVFKD